MTIATALPAIKSPINLSWVALGLASLAWLMSVAYGFQYAISDDARTAYFRGFTLPFAAIVIGITLFTLVEQRSRIRFDALTKNLAFAMMAISWTATCFFYSADLAPIPWWAPVLAVVVVALPCHRKWGSRGSNLVFLTGLMVVAALLIARLPNNAGGDMLEIIQFAAQDLLSGESPYQPYLTVSKKEVPFGYWPGTWLPYLPFVALGIDMRILNLSVLMLLILLFARAANQNDDTQSVLALTLYPFLLSSPVMQHILFGHLWTYWLAACAAMLFTANGRLTAGALVFGFCLASRPTALFLAAPLAAFVWSRHGTMRAIAAMLTAIAVAAALNLPFYLLYGNDFLQNSYGKLVGIGHELVHFSLAGYLGDIGLASAAKIIQVAVLILAMAAIIVKKNLPPDRFIMLTGVTYVWMMLFNSYATRYVYFTGFLLIALGLCMLCVRAAKDGGPLQSRLSTR